MKSLIYIAFISLLFISCKENDEEEDKVILGTYNFTSMEEEHQAYTSRGKIEDMEGFPESYKLALETEDESHNELYSKFIFEKDSIFFINKDTSNSINFQINKNENSIYIKVQNKNDEDDFVWVKFFDIENNNLLSTSAIILYIGIGEFEDELSNLFNISESTGEANFGNWDIFDDEFNLRIANIQPDEFIALTKRKRYYKKQ